MQMYPGYAASSVPSEVASEPTYGGGYNSTMSPTSATSPGSGSGTQTSPPQKVLSHVPVQQLAHQARRMQGNPEEDQAGIDFVLASVPEKSRARDTSPLQYLPPAR